MFKEETLLFMLPFLVGVSNVHEISELPMQPEILKVPLHMHE